MIVLAISVNNSLFDKVLSVSNVTKVERSTKCLCVVTLRQRRKVFMSLPVNLTYTRSCAGGNTLSHFLFTVINASLSYRLKANFFHPFSGRARVFLLLLKEKKGNFPFESNGTSAKNCSRQEKNEPPGT